MRCAHNLQPPAAAAKTAPAAAVWASSDGAAQRPRRPPVAAAAQLLRGGSSNVRGCVTARGFKLLGGGGAAVGADKQQPPQPPTTATARLLASVRWPGSSSTDSSPSGSSSSRQDQGQQVQQQQQQQDVAPAVRGSSSSSSSYLALLAVSLLWGSYAPSLRYLYSMEPLLTPQVLTAHRAVISAATLVAASAATWAYDKHRQRQQQLRELQLLQQEREREEAARRRWLGLLPSLVLNMLAPFGSSSSTTSSRVGSRSREQQQRWSLPFGGLFPDDNSTQTVLDFFSRFRTPLGTGGSQSDAAAAAAVITADSSGSGRSAAAAVLLAGLELGTWNFLATAAQACGLELSTATKAAFLTQTTAVFTPCVAVLFGQAVLPAHWVACLAALVGSCCITMDSVVLAGGDDSGSSASLAAVTEVRGAEAELLVAPPLRAADTAADAQGDLEQPVASSMFEKQQQEQLMMLLPSVQQQQQQGQPVMADERAPAAAALAAGPGQLLPAGSAVSSDAACLDAESWCGARLAGGAAAGAGALPELDASVAAASLAAGAAVQQAPAAAAAGEGAYAAAAVDTAQWQQGGAASAGGAAAVSDGSVAAAVSDGSVAAAAGDAAAAITSGPADLQQPTEAAPTAAATTKAAAQDAAAAAVSSSSSDSIFELSGEVYILAACCCYAMATVRLSMLAPGLDPVQLATSKTLTLAAASLLWLVAVGPGDTPTAATAAVASGAAQPATGEGVVAAVQAAASSWQLPPAFDYGPGLALLCYSAIGPGALATVLQTKGQSTASAAQAQVYYSLTPVWAALLANSWLEGEAMGTMAWVGGGIIIAASIAAAISDVGPDGQAQGDGGGSGAAGQ